MAEEDGAPLSGPKVGKFDALTIDTQAIRKAAFRFDDGALALLKQFNSSPISVVFSTVVIEETTAHLVEEIRRLKADLRKVARDAPRLLSHPPGLLDEEQIGKIHPESEAKNRIDSFLRGVDAQVIPAGMADLNDITRRYFRTLPPFAGTGNKKHEFPDAIAIASIEAWGKANGKRVLAVSEDKGWMERSSEFMTVVPDLTSGARHIPGRSGAPRSPVCRSPN